MLLMPYQEQRKPVKAFRHIYWNMHHPQVTATMWNLTLCICTYIHYVMCVWVCVCVLHDLNSTAFLQGYLSQACFFRPPTMLSSFYRGSPHAQSRPLRSCWSKQSRTKWPETNIRDSWTSSCSHEKHLQQSTGPVELRECPICIHLRLFCCFQCKLMMVICFIRPLARTVSRKFIQGEVQ